VTDGGASITQSADSAAVTVHSSHSTFSDDVLLLKSTRAASASNHFDYISAQTNAGSVKFQVTGLGEVVSKSTVDAATSTEGSIRTQGGLGVKLKTHIGGDLTVEGSTALQATTFTTIAGSSATDTSSKTTGALKTAGGLGVALKAHIGTGLTVDTGGMTVSAGTSALQAVTATTIAGSSTTDTSSKTTGALKTAGGLGVALKAHVGTGLTIDSGGATVTAGGLTVTAGGATVSAGGATVTDGGASITQSADSAAVTVHSSHSTFSDDVLLLKSTRAASASNHFDYISAQTNAGSVKFQVTGLGEVVSKSTVDAATSTEGSIRTQGGLGVKLKTHIGGDLTVEGSTALQATTFTTIAGSSATDTSSKTTGALKTAGGLGVALKAHIGTGLTVDTGGMTVSAGTSALQAVTATTIAGSDNTDTSSKTTGALKTAGGLGVALKAHIGTGLTVDAGGATVTNGGGDITNEANAVVLKAFSKQATQTAAVLQVIAKDTNGFNLIDAQTGASDDSTGGTSKFTVDSAGAGVFSGSVTGSGAYQSSSDKRLKKRITQLQSAMEKLNALRGVHYFWRKGEAPHTYRDFDDSKQVGFIAQEVEAVIPEVVRTDADGYKSMQYSGIIPYAVEALKLHDTTIAQLQGEKKALGDAIAQLQEENKAQGATIAAQGSTIARLQAEQVALQRQVALILSRMHMPAGSEGELASDT